MSIGKDNFTENQFNSLKSEATLKKYPNAKIVGHNEFEYTNKTCPNFDLKGYSYEIFDKQEKNIIVSKANLYNSMNKLDTLETQCLYGEKVKIIKSLVITVFAMQQDGYIGYIKTKLWEKCQCLQIK